MDANAYIIAPSIEQGEIAADQLGLPRARIVSTGRGHGLPPGALPFPEAVSYAPGWERGRLAHRVIDQLQRAYTKRLAAEPEPRTVTISLHLDGKRIAEAVSREINRQFKRP